VPSIWHVQEGIDLIPDKATTLEEVGFLLSKKLKCQSRNFFDEYEFFFVNRLMDVDSWSKTRNKKNIVILYFSKSQLDNRTSGRLDVFLLHISCHPPMFLFRIMDEYIISFHV
jgi:hypothetical protein